MTTMTTAPSTPFWKNPVFVLVCATASAHEGEASYDGWANKGLEHYGSLGIAAEVSDQDDLVDSARHLCSLLQSFLE